MSSATPVSPIHEDVSQAEKLDIFAVPKEVELHHLFHAQLPLNLDQLFQLLWADETKFTMWFYSNKGSCNEVNIDKWDRQGAPASGAPQVRGIRYSRARKSQQENSKELEAVDDQMFETQRLLVAKSEDNPTQRLIVHSSTVVGNTDQSTPAPYQIEVKFYFSEKHSQTQGNQSTDTTNELESEKAAESNNDEKPKASNAPGDQPETKVLFVDSPGSPDQSKFEGVASTQQVARPIKPKRRFDATKLVSNSSGQHCVVDILLGVNFSQDGIPISERKSLQTVILRELITDITLWLNIAQDTAKEFQRTGESIEILKNKLTVNSDVADYQLSIVESTQDPEGRNIAILSALNTDIKQAASSKEGAHISEVVQRSSVLNESLGRRKKKVSKGKSPLSLCTSKGDSCSSNPVSPDTPNGEFLVPNTEAPTDSTDGVKQVEKVPETATVKTEVTSVPVVTNTNTTTAPAVEEETMFSIIAAQAMGTAINIFETVYGFYSECDKVKMLYWSIISFMVVICLPLQCITLSRMGAIDSDLSYQTKILDRYHSPKALSSSNSSIEDFPKFIEALQYSISSMGDTIDIKDLEQESIDSVVQNKYAIIMNSIAALQKRSRANSAAEAETEPNNNGNGNKHSKKASAKSPTAHKRELSYKIALAQMKQMNSIDNSIAFSTWLVATAGTAYFVYRLFFAA